MLRTRLAVTISLCLLSFACGSASRPATSGTESTNVSKFVPVRLGLPDANAAEPAIAASSDGRVFAVWVEHRENDADVFVREFDSAGNANGDPVRVNPQPGQAKAWRGDPPTIKIGSDGTVYIGWTSTPKSSASGTDLYLSVSTDGGRSFMPPTKVNDDSAPGSHGMHSLAIGDGGGVYVAWLDERYLIDVPPEMKHNGEMSGTEPNAELYFAASDDKGRTFGANKKVASDVCPCCKTSITPPGPDGRMYIGYRQVINNAFRHIAVTTSSDGGKTFSVPRIVHDDQWKINACPVSGPSLSTNQNALTVAWYSGGDAGQHGFYQATSLDGGNSFSDPVLVGDGDSGGTPVLLGDQLVFTDSGKLFLTSIGRNDGSQKWELGSGNVPTMALVQDKLFIAFVRPEDAGNSVWLDVFDTKQNGL